MRVFSFGAVESSRTYVPSSRRIDRLSLAMFGADATTPEFTGSRTLPRTVVVTWPTDTDGLLMGGADTYAVKEWVLSADLFAALAEVHRDFPLQNHDVWVTPGRLVPCPESLRRLLLGREGRLSEELRRAIFARTGELFAHVDAIDRQVGRLNPHDTKGA